MFMSKWSVTNHSKGVIEVASCTCLVRGPLLSFFPKDMHIIHCAIVFPLSITFYF